MAIGLLHNIYVTAHGEELGLQPYNIRSRICWDDCGLKTGSLLESGNCYTYVATDRGSSLVRRLRMRFAQNPHLPTVALSRYACTHYPSLRSGSLARRT